MKKITLITLIAVAAVSCVGNRHSSPTSYVERLADFHSLIASTVCQDDSIRFTALCSYPIVREYPLHDIEDSAMMVRYFHILFDDSIKSVLAKATPADWDEFGWRGSTLHSGEYIWCDDYIISSITYRSAKEERLFNDLLKADMATLPAELAHGWVPETCVTDSLGTIYRIDRDAAGERYRLMIYKSGAPLFKAKPDKLCYGTLSIEGSAGTCVYSFPDENGVNRVFLYFRYENSYSLSEKTADCSDAFRIPLTKTYWLDEGNSRLHNE